MSTGLSTKSDFRPVTQGFGEMGEFDPRVWPGSRQNNKKRHKSWGKEVDTGGRSGGCEGEDLKYGDHCTSAENRTHLNRKSAS